MQSAVRFVADRLQRIAVGVMLVALVGAAGCPQNVRPTGDEVADCAKEAAKDIFHTLIPRVSTVIATGPNIATVTIELAKLTAEYGVEVVTCVVETVRDRNGRAAAVASGDEKELHERSEALAAEWLQKHGAQMKQQ